jgi:hypothetical protein
MRPDRTGPARHSPPLLPPSPLPGARATGNSFLPFLPAGPGGAARRVAVAEEPETEQRCFDARAQQLPLPTLFRISSFYLSFLKVRTVASPHRTAAARVKFSFHLEHSSTPASTVQSVIFFPFPDSVISLAVENIGQNTQQFRPCNRIHLKIQNFTRFFITSNLAAEH